MAKKSTVNLLPEYFQTQTNKQVLAATLDQLTQEPKYTKTQGYVGRRVGPGVGADDQYIVENSIDRSNYQLEPGVIEIDSETGNIADAITYPGISDAIELQGGYTDNADRLYQSEYYAWDAFVDYDKMVNFAEYYWLPAGVPSVNVYATGIPLKATYTVTRANGTYSFSGVSGQNPGINLARGGTYEFKIAQQNTSTTNLLVGNNGSNYYYIDYKSNPTLTFVRGNTYIFNISTVGGVYPLYIKTAPSLGTTNIYSDGVYNNGAVSGFLQIVVPQDAPDTLYYCCETVEAMRGTINVVDAIPGDGPKFWIQSEAGVDGTLSYAPNISSRNVLGVTNNGIDLGTITFSVPEKLDQLKYYNMINGGYVDLVSYVPYSAINGKTVEEFLLAYPDGIDGITNIENRTVLFADESSPALAVYQVIYTNNVITFNTVFVPVNNTQFFIQFGTEWAQTLWYTDDAWVQIPPLTAIMDTLYYQDGKNPDMFGAFNLIEQDNTASININDILGKPTYTSPNGVVFSSGLTVTFSGATVPSTYSGNTYYVEGVGESITLTDVKRFVTPETFNQIYPIPYDTTNYDIGAFDAYETFPEYPYYITISKASPDQNSWSRNNRWFHIDVINASYAYNNQPPYVNPALRASRPILEFRSGLRLFNFGTNGIQAVNIIDFGQTNAFANVEGQTKYLVDGYLLVEGSYIIFPNDQDPLVANNIYQVNFITPDTVEPLINQPIINLILVTPTVQVDDTTVCLSGQTQKGISYWFNGITWVKAQQETAINFPNPGAWPLFDVYDQNGISFGDPFIYPSSSFHGSYLFSYALSTSSVVDSILGFNLTYFSLNNIGDIVFNNNLYVDTFNYIKNNTGVTAQVSDGFVRQYTDRTDYTLQIGWQTAITPSIVRQQFQLVYDGNPFKLDVAVTTETTVPPIQLFISDIYIEPNQYTWQIGKNTTTIILNDTYALNSVAEINVVSTQISDTAFYVVPVNLENNPLNGNPDRITLGTVRSHYQSICYNLLNLSGPINGANNTRDLGNIVPYGLQILQQSAPMTMAGYFMRSKEYDIFQALPYNSRQYQIFKTKLLQYPVVNDLMNMPASDIVDQAIAFNAVGKTQNDPFYWSDMIPWGNDYTVTDYLVTPITGKTFNTQQTYSFTTANYLGLLVYYTTTVGNQVETVLLEKNYEYTVSGDSPQITLIFTPEVGSTVSVHEYADTAGSFIPNTPSKMGLYPKYRPAIYLDTTYIQPRMVIRGHDGSITLAFNDIRDQVLLEFETRIYNNIKVDDNPIPLIADEVIPGFFRTTDYSRQEVLDILGVDFLSWVGWNKIPYNTQDYVVGNPFTYNYSSSGSKLTKQFVISNTYEPLLPGAWRGIYQYYYDTTDPNLHPWEMLGFSEEPSWWKNRYSAAPYTNGNFVLWDDLQSGFVADPSYPNGGYYNPLYVRPNLAFIIPADAQGELLSPLDTVVGQSNPLTFQKSWTIGDGGPVEAGWWTSSAYPFAVMRLLALTRPAKFFSLFADRDLYRYETSVNQYLYNGRYRLDANGIQVYGNGVSKASYINWIVDFNRQLGIDSTKELDTALQNLDVRLCHRMAGYTDKTYTSIVIQSSSPNSNNVGLQLPPESYQLLMYKNEPFQQITYSAIVIEIAPNGGYIVYGYNSYNPYFEIFASMNNGAVYTMSANNVSVQVPVQWTNKIVQIPYGYTFANATMTVDFILGYGKYMTSLGITFASIQNNTVMDWTQMANEFLYFAGQGWSVGTIMNLNPSALVFTASQPLSVIDTIDSVVPENLVLNQNRKKFPTHDLIITRLENSFQIESATSATISYLRLRFTSFENIMIIDNIDIFNDLIYDPITNSRQTRVLMSSYVSEWDGTANIPGFIYNDPAEIPTWKPNTKYVKGQIVIYKRQYWQALQIVQPASTFDYVYWAPSNYSKVQTGLLTNLANKADELENTYDIHKGALDPDMDLMAFSLIGFNPRQYMSALDLDEISQVNIYQQFIGTKGTVYATDLFFNANLGRQPSQYDIYENWAILAGTYGANADRSFIEIRLNEALLTANPSTVQLITRGQASIADQPVIYEELWAESTVVTSPNVFPVVTGTFNNTALPSAGYVDVNDVDVMVFTLDDPVEIAVKLSSIGIGTTIWAAKSNAYAWNVYNCRAITPAVILISDNLNNTSVVTFNSAHGLVIGDLFIIRYVSSTIDGAYRVLGTPTVYSVIISYTFVNTNQTSVTCSGLALRLESVRLYQPSDIINLSFSNSLTLNTQTVWIDNDGTGNWVVLRKQSPFTQVDYLAQPLALTGSQYGHSVCQNAYHYSALVGAPYDNTVYAYVKGNITNTIYNFNTILATNTPGVREFGYAIDCGEQVWSVVGAPGSVENTGMALIQYQIQPSYQYVFVQYLVGKNLNERFGQAVAMSWDEYWLAVAAPVDNRVDIYGRVSVDLESVTFYGDGVTTTFNYDDVILIDPTQPGQLQVLVDDKELPVSTYELSNGNVILSEVPGRAVKVEILRRTTVQLDIYEYTVQPAGGHGAYSTYIVTVTHGLYALNQINSGKNYKVGDILTIYGSHLGGVTPDNDILITVQTVSDTGQITKFSFTGLGNVGANTFALKPWFYTVGDINSFSIRVNGTIMKPTVDYTYDPETDTLTYLSFINPGSTIEAHAITWWQFVQSLQVEGIVFNSQFGYSLTMTTEGRQIAVGAPLDVNGSISNGSTYVYNRRILRIQVTDVTDMIYSIGPVQGPVQVIVQGVQLTDATINRSGQYTIDPVAQTITFTNITFTVGDNIEIGTNQIDLIQRLQLSYTFDDARFGHSMDLCTDNDELYIGAPWDGSVSIQAGSLTRYINQSRDFGLTTTTRANPVLNPGDVIHINDLPFVIPENTLVSNIVSAINDAAIPNVYATASPNVTYRGNGTTKVFSYGDLYANTDSYNIIVTVNGRVVTNWVAIENNQIQFTPAPTRNTTIQIIGGLITISAINPEGSYLPYADGANKLTVLPGTGTAFWDLGFNTFVEAQTIYSPEPVTYGHFGSSVSIDTSSVNLCVGAMNGSMYEPTTFDDGTTYFDSNSTVFSDLVADTGVVYTYDYMPAAVSSINSPGMFVFGQQLWDVNTTTTSKFGFAVDYTDGRLLIGVPGANSNSGQTRVYDNATDQPTWATLHYQEPAVDVTLFTSVYSYDKLYFSYQQYYDVINPLQGKILGLAASNIDYISSADPAMYNVGPIHNVGNAWTEDHIGEIWWDTENVRFLDPNQDDIAYASKKWGTVFPGSSVDVYQWISSTVPPLQYTGPGIPISTLTYTVNTSLSDQGIFSTSYYFWVRGLSTIDPIKTLSTNTIASYITDPRSSGIPFVAILNTSSVAIYNATDISAQDTILHIEYNQTPNTTDIHQEFQLIQAGVATSFLNDKLWQKMLDSFCGVDITGSIVPDPNLPPGMKYGVQFRPRQSMFINRYTALQNYLEFTNNILIQYPFVEIRTFPLLYSADPIPPQTTLQADGTLYFNWNKEVASLTELNYQDITAVPLGYKYLVDSDSNQNGNWTIFEVIVNQDGVRLLSLIRIEIFNVPLYWDKVNWYKSGYNKATPISATVINYAALETLSLTQAPVGSSVKVTANNQGSWEIYQRNLDTNWTRVVLENGTIQISDTIWDYIKGGFGYDLSVYDIQLYDQEPVIETRYILESINTELFTNEFQIYRNDLLILMFQYIYSEFQTPSWLTKTSLIDVTHTVRKLEQYPTFLPDNQTYVLDYLNEVKPYHCVVRDFNLEYDGIDTWQGAATDFDCPAFWARTLTVPQYVSPVLLPYTHATTTVQNTISDVGTDSQIWLESPWKEWRNNFGLSVQGINVVNSGSSYITAPKVTVVSNETPTVPAVIVALVNAVGQVSGFNIVNPGAGYITTPTVVIASPGTAAIAVPIMHTGSVTDVKVVSGGAGYMQAPEIQVVGTCTTPAVLRAIINTEGQVTGVIVMDTGSGYTSPPEIIFPVPGTTATARLIMNNGLMREITITMRYDRCEYHSTIVPWIANIKYPDGILARYNNIVWKATSVAATATCTLTVGQVTSVYVTNGGTGSYSSAPRVTVTGDCTSPAVLRAIINASGVVTSIVIVNPGIGYTTAPTLTMDAPGFVQQELFNLDAWVNTPASSLSGADRTMGYYVPGVNMPGLNLPLLISGVDYPGVQVASDTYLGRGDEPYSTSRYSYGMLNYNPGSYDYFSNQFDIDCYYSASYRDIYLGTRPTDINVFGGAYVDTYASHAPEELVPGQVFDTLNLTVTSRTGQAAYGEDWGMPIGRVVERYTPGQSIPWGSTLEYIATIEVFNQTSGLQLIESIDYTVDWVNQSILVIASADAADTIAINTYGVGGGYQLFQSYYTSNDITNTILIPVSYTEIQQPSALFLNGVVNLSFICTSVSENVSKITLDSPLTPTDRLLLVVLGPTWISPISTTDYSWSTAITERFPAWSNKGIYRLSNSVQGTNPVNFICTVDGVRIQGPSAQQYIGNGTNKVFPLPTRLGVDPLDIPVQQIRVYVNSVSVPNGPAASNFQIIEGQVVLGIAPPTNNQVIVAVLLGAEVVISGNNLVFMHPPALDSMIQVTTWNDTTQQGISTDVFIGPYPDTTDNQLILDREVPNTDRMWITLNGIMLSVGYDCILETVLIDGVPRSEIILPTTMSSTDVVMVTMFTDKLVTASSPWRIFQDMRGVQAVYLMSEQTTTVLTQDCTSDADVIHVENALALPTPDVERNIWGIVMVGAERIMYREIDRVANTISSLLRGTAGTAAMQHYTGEPVISSSVGDLAIAENQNYITSDTFLGDDSTTVFTAPDVVMADDSTLEDYEAVQVFVGGTRLTTGYQINTFKPVSISFDVPPPSGVAVTILAERGTWWVNP